MAARVRFTIEKLVYGGDGLARLASPDGRRQVVFVPFTLPGEVVEAELVPAAGGRTVGRAVAILEPSPDRIAPGCEYFGRCGGCQLQHTPAQRQVELKRGILLETLRRTGGVEWGGEVALHAGPAWGYRNRIRLQRAGAGWGYFRRESHEVLPVSHCPIASPRLNRALAEVSGDAGVGESELVADNQDDTLMEGAPLTFLVAGQRYQVSPGSFFQVNRFLTAELVEVVTGGVEGGAAVDLYSGVGLFALPLAQRFARVTAVESHPAAVADLQANALAWPQIEVVNRPALAFLQRRRASPLDLVVADPPRSGLGPALVEALLRLRPRRLHLVSCDPATLGRDLRGLLGGGYHLASLDVFDLFPQTYHIETVAKLTI